MTKRHLFMRFFKEEGFRQKIDEDDDIIFKREGKSHYLEASETDESYFCLNLPDFWKIHTPEEGRRKIT